MISDRLIMRRSAFTLIELLAVILIIGFLVALIIPAILSVRVASRRTQCLNNLRQFGIAIHSYSGSSGLLPVGISDHGYSLHAQLLPFFEQNQLYNSINFQVVSLNPFINSSSAATSLALFTCPADGMAAGIPNATNYPGNLGFGFDEAGPLDNGGIALGLKSAFSLGQVPDGTGSTSGMSEWLVGRGSVRDRDLKRTVYVTRPHIRGLTIYDDFLAECERLDPNNNRVGPPKGLGWLVGSPSFTLYDHSFVPGGRSCINDVFVRQSAFSSGSMHGDGCNVMFLDGHVASMRAGISPAVWRAIGTRSGGEAISSND